MRFIREHLDEDYLLHIQWEIFFFGRITVSMNLISISTLFSSHAKDIIGVDISYEELRLVRMTHSAGKPLLSDYAAIPFSDGISRNSPEFPEFLKSAMKNFCPSSGKKNIWTVASMTKAGSRYLKIPKVSENQISNAAYWTLKKEEPLFKENEHVFTLGLIEKSCEKSEDRIELMACTALRYDVEKLQQLFESIGFPLTGISLYPLAVQNLFQSGWIEPEDHSMATLWIGRSRSRIDVFFPGGTLALCRSVKTSERSMIESVREKIGRENYGFRLMAQQFFSSMISGKLPLSIEGAESFGEKQIFRMVQPALDRLVRQLERTFDHYNVNICKVPIGKIYVSGAIAGYSPLVEYLAERCGEDIHTAEMNPFPSRNGQSPESADTRLSFVPAVGLALSDNAITPNFLLTYQDRKKLEKIFRVRRAVSAVCIVLMLICCGMYYWQKTVIGRKENAAAVLETELHRLMLQADQDIIRRLTAFQVAFKEKNGRIMLTRDMIRQLDSHINSQKQKQKMSAARYATIAAMSDILIVTPKNIQLTSLSITAQKSDSQKNETMPISVEGIVRGSHAEFENILNTYLTELRKSPVLIRTAISKKQADISEDQEVLRFNLQAEVSRN